MERPKSTLETKPKLPLAGSSFATSTFSPSSILKISERIFEAMGAATPPPEAPPLTMTQTA